ncbi:MAG: XRE family transcriptional regulator [Gottschalkiaceae bacterium]|nr:MAG: XRE family transcriptional regulator [Gottschalkiaceae bacterium]
MVNVNKLKGKIVEKELTIEKLAERIGLDRSTLYRKISNDGETFTIREANLICNELGLTGKEATAIFFSQFVA